MASLSVCIPAGTYVYWRSSGVGGGKALYAETGLSLQFQLAPCSCLLPVHRRPLFIIDSAQLVFDLLSNI